MIMNDTEVYELICRMKEYGGSFVVALANALQKADRQNKQRLMDAFPDYVNEYGPTSKFPMPIDLLLNVNLTETNDTMCQL
jgi:hypothetical protein